MKKNLIIDTGIFLSFLAAMEPRMTGVALHEWLSVALAGTILIHLLLHWDWIAAVALKFFRKLLHTSRLKFVVDLLLFIAMTALMVSGLMISKVVLPALGLAAPQDFAWRMLHSTTADASLVLLGLHFALNWKWVVFAVKKSVFAPAAALFARRPRAAAAGAEAVDNQALPD